MLRTLRALLTDDQAGPTGWIPLHDGCTILVSDYPKAGFEYNSLTLEWARLDSNQRPRDYESPALTV